VTETGTGVKAKKVTEAVAAQDSSKELKETEAMAHQDTGKGSSREVKRGWRRGFAYFSGEMHLSCTS